MEHHVSKGFGGCTESIVHTVTGDLSPLRICGHTTRMVAEMRRFLLILLAVSVVACERSSPTAPSSTPNISGNWTLILGSFSPNSPVFFATFRDSSGSLSGATSWSDGSYTLSGTHVSSNLEFTATSAQPPARVWHFSGVLSQNQIVGNASTDSAVVRVTLLKGDVVPP